MDKRIDQLHRPGRRLWPLPAVLLAAFGLCSVAIGLVVGMTGTGIEPDGMFVPCGPPLIGRVDSDWDPRCLPLMNSDRINTLLALGIGALLIALALLVAWRSRSAIRQSSNPLAHNPLSSHGVCPRKNHGH